MAVKKTEKDEPQDLSAFLGTDDVYMNYSDERNKPLRAEVDPDADDDVKAEHEEIVRVEDRAYEIQSQQREQAGRDPETGEPLEVGYDASYEAVRDQYRHGSGWSPNIPHAMTGEPNPSAKPAEEAPATVNPDGTTGDEGDKGVGRGTGSPPPPAPAAPKTETK